MLRAWGRDPVIERVLDQWLLGPKLQSKFTEYYIAALV